jgi:catechol 2,3-dioxygenase-like lactoylglutathione lyase family enzyme
MRVHGIVWGGVRTERFDETVAFFRDLLGVPLEEPHEGFAWSRMPNTSQFEVFGSDDPDHGHFTTGPVVEFLVDDVHAAAEDLRAAGVEVWGPWGTPGDGWLHFRAPDGNVYGLTAGARYRR